MSHKNLQSFLFLSAAFALSGCGGGGALDESSSSAIDGYAESTNKAIESLNAAKTAVSFVARGTLAGNTGPTVELRVDGIQIGRVQVKSAGFQSYNFPSAKISSNSTLSIALLNHDGDKNHSRDLYVQSVTVGERNIPILPSTCSYDRGAGKLAYDGIDVIPCQQAMVWNGSLQIPLALPTNLSTSTLASTANFEPSGENRMPDASRKVWVHELIPVPTFQPATPYGADYPLALRQSYESKLREQDSPATLVAAGITGVQLLWGEGDNVIDHFSSKLDQFEGTGLELAPVLSVDTVAGAADMIQAWVRIANGRTAAARILSDGISKYIVSFYGSRYHKGTDFWIALREQLKTRGLNVFLVGDVISAISLHGGTVEPYQIEPFAINNLHDYIGVFDANWTFDDGVDCDWVNWMGVAKLKNVPYAGGMMPAYNRESESSGGYSDAEGTAKYRRQWHYALDSGLAWNHINTWNDVAERHEIWPSSEWSYTRADITAFFSAVLRSQTWPANLKTPQLYITTPQRINSDGTPRIAEALLLNTSTTPMTVSAQLLDANGANVGGAKSSSVAAKTDGAVVLNVGATTVPMSGFYRVLARSLDVNGVEVQRVLSAPILYYAAGDSGDFTARMKYNSIPARLSLPGQVGIAVAGNPTQGAATATPIAPKGSQVRFADILQNTYLVRTQFDPLQLSPISVPMPANSVNMSGTLSNVQAKGYYIARVIDSSERVGYSDPVRY